MKALRPTLSVARRAVVQLALLLPLLAVPTFAPESAEAGVLIKRVRSGGTTSGVRGYRTQRTTDVAARLQPSMKVRSTAGSLAKIRKNQERYQRRLQRWEEKRQAKLRRQRERQFREQEKLAKEYAKRSDKAQRERERQQARNPEPRPAPDDGKVSKEDRAKAEVTLDRKREDGSRASSPALRDPRRKPQQEGLFQRMWRRLFGSGS